MFEENGSLVSEAIAEVGGLVVCCEVVGVSQAESKEELSNAEKESKL